MKKLAILAVLAALSGAGCYVVATPRGVALVVPMPALTLIPGTGIRYFVDASGNYVLAQGGYYYRHVGGLWYRSSYWNRGWITVTAVPPVFLTIPRTHPVHRRLVIHHPGYRVLRPRPRVLIGPKKTPAPPVKGAPGKKPPKKKPPKKKPPPL